MDVVANIIADRGPVLASIAVIATTVFFATLLFGNSNTSQLPLVGEEYGNAEKRRKAFITKGLEFYKKGYALYKSKAFRLTSLDGDVIVLPRHLMEEVRQLPDDIINITKAFQITNEQKHLKMGNPRRTEFLIYVIQHHLTRGLARINPRLSAETKRTVHAELPPCDDWTRVGVYKTLCRIVAIVSGAIFIGDELCHSEEYIEASIGYTLDFLGAVENLKKWRRGLRWFGRYFTPEVDKLFADRKKAHAFLGPIIAQRRAAIKAGQEMPDDALQWMINSIDKFGLSDAELAETQLGMSLAAIHTTTLTLTLIIYDLVIRPDIVEELREEIRTVIAEYDGVMTTQALFDMKLLDSVMKESQRINPGSLNRFRRYVAKPVTLSDGTHLPAGYMVETAHALTISDPDLYPNPDEFDAHRFQNLRNGSAEDRLGYKNKEQYQFVTMTKDFMSFGYGRHSCPGRYFAAQEIKLILARLLLDYDMRMPDGLTERYANLVMGTDAFPDATKEVLFKRVKTDV